MSKGSDKEEENQGSQLLEIPQNRSNNNYINIPGRSFRVERVSFVEVRPGGGGGGVAAVHLQRVLELGDASCLFPHLLSVLCGVEGEEDLVVDCFHALVHPLLLLEEEEEQQEDQEEEVEVVRGVLEDLFPGEEEEESEMVHFLRTIPGHWVLPLMTCSQNTYFSWTVCFP